MPVILQPLAWAYGRVMRIRNWRFDTGQTPVETVGVPVISVGNLSVGGTGKTPMCAWVLQLLTENGHKPAMLSRGYGRKTSGFRQVVAGSTAREVGDEPLEVFRRFDGKVPVFVCENRAEGAQRLLQADDSINAIVLDDAYQHRFIYRDINILLTDYSRLYTRDKVLPQGRLRELPEGAARADIIVVTKCPPSLSAQQAQAISDELRPQTRQQVFFSAINYEPIGTELHDKDVLIFTGIAKPQPLIDHYTPLCRSVQTMLYGDHHTFSAAEISTIATAAEQADIVVTTAKDYSRLPAGLPPVLRDKLRVQRIAVEILLEQKEKIRNTIIDKFYYE